MADHLTIDSESESNVFSERIVEVGKEIGVSLIGHDAIRLGVVEEVAAETLDRLKKVSPEVELAGVVIIPSITSEQVEKIYPGLDVNYMNAFKEVFGNSESVLVIYRNPNRLNNISFYDELKKIKGKIFQGKKPDSPAGWGSSLRSAIPLPGDRMKFEEVSRKVKEKSLEPDDYIGLTDHLLHTPDNDLELAGLLQLVPEVDAIEIFGEETAKKYLDWARLKINEEKEVS